MLGNWSLGSYFKQGTIALVFEFLTEVVKLDPQKLFVTVFAGNADAPRDTESVTIWKSIFKKVGIDAKDIDESDKNGTQDGRIFYYPEKKNWWSRSGVPSAMPAGEPGGPDSEVFYDFGTDLHLHENSQWKNEQCHVNCDCGRFMEIGNSVFMQYQKQADGSFKELPQQNVDFGGGFERILAASTNSIDMFTIASLHHFSKQLKKFLEKYTKVKTKETFASLQIMFAQQQCWHRMAYDLQTKSKDM